jgi:hypothetical protein
MQLGELYLGAAGIVAVFVLGLILGWISAAPAWAQGADPIWQQLAANRAAQCDTQIHDLLKTLDDDKKQIAELQKEIEELKKK